MMGATIVFGAGSVRLMDDIAARIRQILEENGWSAAELSLLARVPLWAAVLRIAMTSVMHPTQNDLAAYTGVLTRGV